MIKKRKERQGLIILSEVNFQRLSYTMSIQHYFISNLQWRKPKKLIHSPLIFHSSCVICFPFHFSLSNEEDSLKGFKSFSCLNLQGYYSTCFIQFAFMMLDVLSYFKSVYWISLPKVANNSWGNTELHLDKWLPQLQTFLERCSQLIFYKFL